MGEDFVTVPLVPADCWPEIWDYIPKELHGPDLMVPAASIALAACAEHEDEKACAGANWTPCRQPGREMDRHLWRPHSEGCQPCADFTEAQPFEYGYWPAEEWRALPDLSISQTITK